MAAVRQFDFYQVFIFKTFDDPAADHTRGQLIVENLFMFFRKPFDQTMDFKALDRRCGNLGMRRVTFGINYLHFRDVLFYLRHDFTADPVGISA